MALEKLLTVEEAAELLRVSPKTVKDWCRASKLPCLKVGRAWRLQASALEAWMKPAMHVVKGGEA